MAAGYEAFETTSKVRETFVSVQLPPGIEVVATELEGPVFADEQGMTLYIWPQQQLRNGNLGDRRNSGVPTCGETIYEQTSGLMSPYPPGDLLPDLDRRRSCEQLWKPKLAPGDANGDNYGEFNGARNGFKAFWLRDDYRDNAIGISLKDITGR